MCRRGQYDVAHSSDLILSFQAATAIDNWGSNVAAEKLSQHAHAIFLLSDWRGISTASFCAEA